MQNNRSKTGTNRYDFPVYGTQGGGLVREIGGRYIFVTVPDCDGLAVGDELPEQWSIVPANESARELALQADREDAF